MRIIPTRWHAETWVCSIRGHVAPALRARVIRDSDRELAVDTADGRRLSRCLRCDLWLDGHPPQIGVAAYDVVPPLSELELPRRGKPLYNAILIRLIAGSRAIHSLVFGLLATVLLLLDTNLGNLKSWANDVLNRLNNVAGDTGQAQGRDFLSKQLRKIGALDKHTLTILGATAAAYCVLEGVEAVGLWRERRWAEYLTVIATSGFLPLEIHELIARVTVIRLLALIVNVAIVVWLLLNKRLFGLRGGEQALHESIDWNAVLSAPPSPDGGPTAPLAAAST